MAFMVTYAGFNSAPNNMGDLRSFINQNPNNLSMSVEELIFSKNSNGNYPSRPPNAFILFRKNLAAQFRKQKISPKKTGKQMSIIAKHKWNELDNDTRNFFNIISEANRSIHMQRHPFYDYNYTRNSKKQLKVINNFVKSFMGDLKVPIKKI